LLNKLTPEYGGRHALTTSDRDLDWIDEYDMKIRFNQRTWCRTNGEILTKAMQESFGNFLWETTMIEAAEWVKSQPHEKRAAREMAWLKINEQGTIGQPVWCKFTIWKMKLDEWAKPGKLPRNIANMSVENSLQGVVWCEDAKHHISGKPLKYQGNECLFLVDPSPESVTTALVDLWHSPKPVSMLIFSDDAVLKIQNENVKRVYNIDFSSNDCCKGRELLMLMFTILNCPTEVRTALWTQMLNNVKLYDVTHYDIRLYLSVLEPYMPTGITATTLINTFSHFMTFIQLVHALIYILQVDDEDEIQYRIIKMGEEYGHKLTLDKCERIEHMQFLKQSLILGVDGNYHATLNLGVIIRATGVCRQDLPGRGPIAERAQDFQHTLMHGLLHGFEYPPLQKLQPPGKLIKMKYEDAFGAARYTMKATTVNRFERENFYKRYETVTDADIYEFEEMCSQSGFGTVMYCQLINKVLQKDYGLQCPIRLP
jgi:hypothetical protein